MQKERRLDRQTDRYDEANICFRSFTKAPKRRLVEEIEKIKISARWVSSVKSNREGWHAMNMTRKVRQIQHNQNNRWSGMNETQTMKPIQQTT